MIPLRLSPLRLVLPLLVLAAPFSRGQPAVRKQVHSEADLPRHSYALNTPASALAQADDSVFAAFATKVRADLEAELRDYDIADRSTRRDLLATKLDLQELAGDFPGALETATALRALEDKPAAKLTTGLLTRALLGAALAVRTTAGPRFEEEFERRYHEGVAALPWDVVQDWAKASYASARLGARAPRLAFLMTELNPAVQKSHALNDAEASTLIEARAYLQFVVPIAPIQARVLRAYIAAHNTPKPDVWADRAVTLTPAEARMPVLIGIWDSGVDVSLFPGQVFDDPQPTASGTHGLAFDAEGAPSRSWLAPLTAGQEKAYPEIRDDLQGRLDIQEGHESPQAAALEKKMKTLSPEQLHQLLEFRKYIGFYVHGTHCAGIAVRGNPAARLVVARFDDELPDLPFAPTLDWAHRLAADFLQMSDYFRTRHVRVVNLSWGDDREEFEFWLTKTGGGADPAGRQQRAAELYAAWRQGIETAIRNAPDTLFVTAAGNSDSNTGFTEDVPASLRLPNLIAVGAVNQAGEETSFTSYGQAVLVHADGYDVASRVPGGAILKLSGTSMACPNVVNLAAKLLALDPSLTPAQVIDLIRRGATTTADGRLHLIDERRSVALLQANRPH